MNAAACQQLMEGVGSGVGASLRAVDCAATVTAQAAFGRLFGTDGALMPALTILLTMFIAFFAIALLTGRSRIGISTLTPRMVTLGLVVTFATSWVAYQSVFWNLAAGAPDWVAGVLMNTDGSATQVFADKIDVVFAALIDASGEEAMEGTQSTFSPPGLLWMGGTLLLLGTVGLLATCKIALAVLLALGPIFVVMALFSGTRGLFTGWLKGVVMLSVTPLFAVLGGSLMLELAVPVLSALAQNPDKIEPRAAMAFFMIGAVHAALMIMVLKVAGTMVAGWTVFGLARSDAEGEAKGSAMPARPAAPLVTPAALRGDQVRPTGAGSRQIVVSANSYAAANDSGPAGGVRRETTVVTGGAPPASNQSGRGVSRARGIGSRFRAAPSGAGRARKSENMQ